MRWSNSNPPTLNSPPASAVAITAVRVSPLHNGKKNSHEASLTEHDADMRALERWMAVFTVARVVLCMRPRRRPKFSYKDRGAG